MKKRFLILGTATILAAQNLSFAQAPGPKDDKPDNDGRREKRERFFQRLSPEERERFQAARAKALQDPKIKELREQSEKANMEFFKAVREKMQEIDPGLAEIVKGKGPDELRDGGPGKMGPGEPGRPEGREWKDRKGDHHGFGSLSEEDRAKILAAREKAKADPAVQEAEKKKAAAETPEARKAAGDEYGKAMHAAMLKADPSLAPILEKLGPKPGGPQGPPPPMPPAPGGDGDPMLAPE